MFIKGFDFWLDQSFAHASDPVETSYTFEILLKFVHDRSMHVETTGYIKQPVVIVFLAIQEINNSDKNKNLKLISLLIMFLLIHTNGISNEKIRNVLFKKANIAKKLIR